MATLVAATVSELSLPKTATWSPTLMVENVGEPTDGSRYVVDELTSTVTVVPS
jgi:hypothetical protein